MNKTILGIVIVLIIIVAGLGVWWMYGGKFATAPAGNSAINSADNTNPVQNTTLDLSNNGISKIPMQVFSETQLENLDVSNNKITGAIQSQIGNLKNLKVLNASNNLMTGVPAEIGQLQKLEILDLSNNKLTGLPNELGNLKNLKLLDLSGNNYSQSDFDGIKSKLPLTTQIITK